MHEYSRGNHIFKLKLCFEKPRILQSARARKPALERLMQALSIFLRLALSARATTWTLERTLCMLTIRSSVGFVARAWITTNQYFFPNLQVTRAKEVTLERPLSFCMSARARKSTLERGPYFQKFCLSVPTYVLASSLHLRHS